MFQSISIQYYICHCLARLAEELFDPLPVFFRRYMFLMGADYYFKIWEGFFKRLLILFLERAKGLHAISEMDGIDLELSQRPYPLEQLIGASQSRTTGTIDDAYQCQLLICRIFAKRPFPLPEISKAGN